MVLANTITSLPNTNPDLAKEWHPTKNAPLSPKDVTQGSGKEVWWVCGKGHEWKAAIYNRNRGVGCPYCSGRLATKGKNLQVINPSLAKEWHPTKNAPLSPKDVTQGSGKEVWWVCGKGHEWEARIYYRNRGTSCPYCAGKKVCNDNCLQTVNPSLAKEWHPTKNETLTPRDVTPNSNKKVWWSCSKRHEWRTTVAHRNHGTGCPYCAGKKVCNDNCLQTANPSLAKEWHPTKNETLTPRDVTPNFNKKVWWSCSKRHEWKAAINNRNKGAGCPYCSGRLATKGKNLQVINPSLAKEWHPTKNAPLTPRDVTPSSHKKVWWVCSKNHEWEARIDARNRGTSCPYCSGRKR